MYFIIYLIKTVKKIGEVKLNQYELSVCVIDVLELITFIKDGLAIEFKNLTSFKSF